MFTLAVLTLPVGAFDMGITPVLLEENEETGYLYNLTGLGSFSTNVMYGETASVAFVELYDDMFPVIFLNDERTNFDSGTFWEAGKYTLYFYADDTLEGDYGYFTFTLENDYSDFLSACDSQRVKVEYPTLEVSYKDGAFVYTLPNGDWIGSTAPLGGHGGQSAIVTLGSNMRIVAAYFNGDYLSLPDTLTFTRVGTYFFTLYSDEYGTLGDESYVLNFSFTLGGDVVQDTSLVPSPYGFTLTNLTKDGQALACPMGNYAYLPNDGVYTLTYAVGNTTYTRSLVKDSTAPALFFNQPTYTDDILDQEVSFTLSDPTATVTIKRNGNAVVASRNTIARNGYYQMEISDQYGNTRSYDFTVDLANDDWGSYLMLLPVAGLLVGLIFVYRRFFIRFNVR